MAKITVLDGHTMNPGDLSWEALEALGELTVYDRTPSEKIIDWARDAEIVLTNKVKFDAPVLAQLPKLKCISVMATGYDVIDVKTAREQGIVVCNVKGYATDSVAQHVFALMLECWSKVALHHQSVLNGDWEKSPHWSYTISTTTELAGKAIGIFGFGQIGRKVAQIALSFGMKVLAHHKHPQRDKMDGVAFVSLEQLLRQSEVVTLHAPLTNETKGIINRERLGWMQPDALLINTGRGGLVVEEALKEALDKGIIGGAGLDVLSTEPPTAGNILIGAPNCIITPHNAWATKASRQRLLEGSVRNVQAFLDGTPINKIGR